MTSHYNPFIDSNQFFFKNGSVYYNRPCKETYLDALLHGLSLDSVIYSQELCTVNTKSTEKTIYCIADTKHVSSKFNYDETIESNIKLPIYNGKKKLSKKEFLKTKKHAPRKLAVVQKHKKNIHLKARTIKSWEQNEYSNRTKLDLDDESECICYPWFDEELGEKVYEVDELGEFDEFNEFNEVDEFEVERAERRWAFGY
jgi:hypothetical protein